MHLLRVGMWVKGRLLIFDLGFYSAPLFEQLDRHGGYFLCRMKKQGNPVIACSHLTEHRHMVGQKLRDALASTDDRAGRAALLRRLETFLRHEALDPNRKRNPLASRAEMGLHAWR